MSLWQEFRDSISSAIAFPADYFAGWFGVAPSESGVEVNELTAMQISAYVSCVRVISGAISTLPFRVWYTDDDGSERLAPEHVLDYALNLQPNPDTTAADFWSTVMVHILQTGNSYAEVGRNNAGQAAALYLRSPFRTVPWRTVDGKLIYKTTDNWANGGWYERIVPASEMVHFTGMGLDGLVGLSPVKYYAREVLGSDLAAQSYGAKFFANDSRPGGYLKSTAFMNDEKKKKAAETWVQAHSRGGSHSMAILDGGLTWEKVGVNPEEAQFLQTRKFNREQIAGIFGVPVHFIGESVESRANMEQRGLEFLTYTLKPHIEKLQQAVNVKMFPALGRSAGRFRAKMDTTMFERATYADLLRGIQIGRYAGVYTVNEARKLLGEQPYSQEQQESQDPADKLWMPVNMITVDEESGKAPAENAPEGTGGSDQTGGEGGAKPPRQTGQGGKRELDRYFRLFYPGFRDAFGRLSARRKVNSDDFQRALGPSLMQLASVFSFAPDAEADDMVLPPASAQFVRDYIAKLGRRVRFRGDLDALAELEFHRAAEVLRAVCQPREREEDENQRDNSLEEEEEHQEVRQ